MSTPSGNFSSKGVGQTSNPAAGQHVGPAGAGVCSSLTSPYAEPAQQESCLQEAGSAGTSTNLTC
jgi:hypothetical protein